MLSMADAVRIAQASDEEPRKFWLEANQVQAHWQMPEE
jgi:hypothetical protein